MFEFRLTGPRGDNPLGFLVCLGAVAALEDAGEEALLAWEGIRPRLWTTLEKATEGVETEEDRRRALAEVLFRTLRRQRGAGAEEAQRAKKEMEAAKTAGKKKREEIKKRKLGREAGKETLRAEWEPLQEIHRKKQAQFRQAMMTSGADASVALGKNLTETNAVLLEHVKAASERCSLKDRRSVDLATAYGTGDPSLPFEFMLGTPWALVSGSGSQDFLSSVEKLMVECKEAHLARALFGPWEADNEKYSLRLDTADDRRHALMAQNPTAAGNKPKTLWGANRLAFEALRFFPAVPAAGGMRVRGWRAKGGNWKEGCQVRWPLWQCALSSAVIHSLLGASDLWLDKAAAGERLRGMGIKVVMESRRIAVGQGSNKKYNLAPATPVWIAG